MMSKKKEEEELPSRGGLVAEKEFQRDSSRLTYMIFDSLESTSREEPNILNQVTVTVLEIQHGSCNFKGCALRMRPSDET